VKPAKGDPKAKAKMKMAWLACIGSRKAAKTLGKKRNSIISEKASYPESHANAASASESASRRAKIRRLSVMKANHEYYSSESALQRRKSWLGESVNRSYQLVISGWRIESGVASKMAEEGIRREVAANIA